MEIYIEYALAENFLLDAMLLWLALKAAKQQISFKRIALASAFGAAFAVIFPLLDTGKILSYILKFSVGALLTLIAVKGKGIGRYLLTGALFFGFSFALVKELYRRRAVRRFVYLCRVTLGDRSIKADGFLDSGNRAKVKGIPVCFLSPDLAFDLLGERTMTEEMTIVTMGGESTIKIFLADRLEIYCGDKPNIIDKVYFAPSGNIRAREYKIILNAAVLSD